MKQLLCQLSHLVAPGWKRLRSGFPTFRAFCRVTQPARKVWRRWSLCHQGTDPALPFIQGRRSWERSPCVPASLGSSPSAERGGLFRSGGLPCSLLFSRGETQGGGTLSSLPKEFLKRLLKIMTTQRRSLLLASCHLRLSGPSEVQDPSGWWTGFRRIWRKNHWKRLPRQFCYFKSYCWGKHRVF